MHTIQHHTDDVLLLYFPETWSLRAHGDCRAFVLWEHHVKISQGLPPSPERESHSSVPSSPLLSPSQYTPRTHLRVWAMSQSCESLEILLRLLRILCCFILSASKVSSGGVGVSLANWAGDVSSESANGEHVTQPQMNPVQPPRTEDAEPLRCRCCQRTKKNYTTSEKNVCKVVSKSSVSWLEVRIV